jgi:TolB-like protein/DNA-binding winged helix-turn-helix (wHTH) protein/Tfp pilus assembly protein PilF
LQDQPFRILQILLAHPGEVVGRDELRRQIWPSDTFVDFERGLNNAVKRLREALGDSAETPRYIETLPKRGYRFIAQIKEDKIRDCQDGNRAHPKELEEGLDSPIRRRGWARLIAVACASVGLLGILVGLNVAGFRDRVYGNLAPPKIQSIAVLPLTNLSADPAEEYFADGMTDALITDLAQIDSLKVISRTSTMRYKKSDKTLPEIARELNVDGIIEGTVQRSADRVRITAQLIQASTDKHVWANSYERDARDVLSMESEIAGAIANQIQARLTPEQKARLAGVRPMNLKALEAYLRGNYHVTLAQDVQYRIGQQDTMQSELRVARDFFEKAISEDPNFAPAYVGLAETWLDRSVAERGPEKEREALQKALLLDPTLAQAHLALGNLEFTRFWNWASAEREIKRAIELNPNLADAHARYAEFLDSMGRFDEGMREYLRAQELDPGHYGPQPNPFFTRRQYDKAVEMDRNDIERHAFGFFPHLDLAQVYEAKGMHVEAVEEWEIVMRMLGYEGIASAMQRGFKAGGYRHALKEWVRGMEAARAQGDNIPSWAPAQAYAYLDDRDHAFAWLAKAYEERDIALQGLRVDPSWDNIRSDPRFQDLIRRIGLPE